MTHREEGRLREEKRDRGGRETAVNGATGRSVKRSNLVMLVTPRKSNRLGEA